MVILQISLGERQVGLNHLHRRMPQHHLQAVHITKFPPEFNCESVPESVHIRFFQEVNS